MKKNKLVIISVMILSLSMIIMSSSNLLGYKSMYYSNLTSKNDIAFISKILKEEGIPNKDINDYKKLVKNYNKQFLNISHNRGLFKTSKLNISYDEVTAMNIWNKLTSNLYSDINCRLAAFKIMKSKIIVKDKYNGLLSNLMFDYSSLDNISNLNFNELDKNAFNALNGAMIPPKTTDRIAISKFINNEWHKRGVFFNNNEDITLINVFIHDVSFNELFIGHCGVLIKTNTGYLFLEKVSPTLPYQLSVINSKDELVSYLDTLYKNRFEDGGVKPLYMENNRLLNK